MIWPTLALGRSLFRLCWVFRVHRSRRAVIWALLGVTALHGHFALAATAKRSDQHAACALIEHARIAAHLPGLTAAVERRDGSIVEFASGRSAGDHRRIEPNAKFLSGSIGKTFVAALAMELYSRKVLDLDAPLTGLLGSEPWFRALPNSCCVTLRELLTQSSGWLDHVEDIQAFRTAVSGRVQACANCGFPVLESIGFLVGTRPLFPPGRGYHYSDTNYLVAGLAIEKATGRGYYELLRELILSPLHLTEIVPSNQNVIPGLVSGRIAPHTNYFGLNAASTMRDGRLLYNPGLEWTGGGLAASSADLARWATALYSGRALPEPYLHELFASVATGQPFLRYGLGVYIRGRGADVEYGHRGSIPGYRSIMRYSPARHLAVVVQFNADDDKHLAWSFADVATKANAMIGRPRLPLMAISCD